MAITIEQRISLDKTAKTKKDGVYSRYRIKYAVKGGIMRFYAEGRDIYQVVGIFATHIGRVETYEIKTILKELLVGLN